MPIAQYRAVVRGGAGGDQKREQKEKYTTIGTPRFENLMTALQYPFKKSPNEIKAYINSYKNMNSPT